MCFASEAIDSRGEGGRAHALKFAALEAFENLRRASRQPAQKIERGGAVTRNPVDIINTFPSSVFIRVGPGDLGAGLLA